MTEPDSDKHERAPLLVIAAIVGPLIPTLYVLLYGPMLLLVKHGVLGESAFLWFYAPIEYLGDKSQTIDGLFFWYARLWGAL